MHTWSPIFFAGYWLGSLKYWYERNKVNYLVANSAVWNDDAVRGALDSAANLVKNLPFIKSLSGYWKFFLASSPKKVPENFYDTAFGDLDWDTLPGKHLYIYIYIYIYSLECKYETYLDCLLFLHWWKFSVHLSVSSFTPIIIIL